MADSASEGLSTFITIGDDELDAIKEAENKLGKSNTIKNLTDILALAGLGFDIFGNQGSSSRGGIGDLEDQIERSTNILDQRSEETENKILENQAGRFGDQFTGTETRDYIDQANQRFADITSSLTNQYTNLLRDERPDLSDYTQKLGGTIADSRSTYGLLNSPAMDAYQGIIEVDPKTITDSIRTEPFEERAYNITNPLINYTNDADSMYMIENSGDKALADYKFAMGDGRGAGQGLMNYTGMAR